jgi:hypothetical protein
MSQSHGHKPYVPAVPLVPDVPNVLAVQSVKRIKCLWVRRSLQFPSFPWRRESRFLRFLGGLSPFETVAFTWVDTNDQKTVVIGTLRIVRKLSRSEKA